MMESLEESELCFPQLLNASCRRIRRPHPVVVLTHTILSSISLLTVTLNLLVIISISHYKQLHTHTNHLLLSLAVSDFLVGFLIILQNIAINGCWFLGDFVCTVYYVLDYTITSASIGNMVLISVDRYVAICDPLRYPTHVTGTRIRISICLCWTCSAIFQFMRFRDSLRQPGRYNTCTGECVVIIDYASGIADLFLSFIGPVTVIIVLYMRVFVVAVSQARAMRSHIAATRLQRTVTNKKSELKAARTIGVVVTVFLVCICPYFCVALSAQHISLNARSSAFVISLFYFNSCLNPLIFAVFYPWFRKSIKLIVTLQILKPDSCEVSIMET